MVPLCTLWSDPLIRVVCPNRGNRLYLSVFCSFGLVSAVFICCCNLCFYFLGHLLVQLVLPWCPVDTFVLLLCHIHWYSALCLKYIWFDLIWNWISEVNRATRVNSDARYSHKQEFGHRVEIFFLGWLWRTMPPTQIFPTSGILRKDSS